MRKDFPSSDSIQILLTYSHNTDNIFYVFRSRFPISFTDAKGNKVTADALMAHSDTNTIYIAFEQQGNVVGEVSFDHQNISKVRSLLSQIKNSKPEVGVDFFFKGGSRVTFDKGSSRMTLFSKRGKKLGQSIISIPVMVKEIENVEEALKKQKAFRSYNARGFAFNLWFTKDAKCVLRLGDSYKKAVDLVPEDLSDFKDFLTSA